MVVSKMKTGVILACSQLYDSIFIGVYIGPLEEEGIMRSALIGTDGLELIASKERPEVSLDELSGVWKVLV